VSSTSWYEVVSKDTPLEQGDFIFRCPTIDIDGDYEELKPEDIAPAKIVLRDLVIMSQSCDLKDEGIDYVILCQVYPFSALTHLHSNGKKGSLVSDKMPRYALLDKNSFEGFPNEHLVVDLSMVFPVPLQYIKDMRESRSTRLRLVSPYREYLSQKFAYLYMRVGKPNPVTPL
jgi:hypothetical protein